MFPLWDNDDKDENAEQIVNIVKAEFGEFGQNWRWADRHWPPNGVLVSKTDGTASDADAEEKDGEKMTGKQVNIDELSSQMEAGFIKVMDVMKESFISVELKIDFLEDKVDKVASELAVLKGKVNGKEDDSRKRQAGGTLSEAESQPAKKSKKGDVEDKDDEPVALKNGNEGDKPDDAAGNSMGEKDPVHIDSTNHPEGLSLDNHLSIILHPSIENDDKNLAKNRAKSR